MKIQKSKREEGQALILIAFGIIGLLAFVVLAVDGGMVFFDRRSAQSAADAAALAGAYEYARNPWQTGDLTGNQATYTRIENAALTRAHENAYGRTDGKTVTVFWDPINPPTAGSIHLVNGDANYMHYVRVRITSPVSTSFIHLLGFLGPIQNTVEAVAYVWPPEKMDAFAGSGLVALAPTGPGMFYMSGNLSANLAGGGIFVNSNDACAFNNPGNSAFLFTPAVTTVGGICGASSTTLVVPPGGTQTSSSVPPPTPVTYPPLILVADPSTLSGSECLTNPLDQALVNSTVPHDGITYDLEMLPGPYSSGFSLPNNKLVFMRPGIFCIKFSFDLNSKQGIGGKDVLIYLYGSDPCRFTWNGGAFIHLEGYNKEPYPHMLMYIKPNYLNPTAGPVKFNGTEDSFIKGTIYAPACSVDMNGTGGNFYQGQVVGYNITLLGGASINMQYVTADNWKPQGPARMDLNQ